MEEIFGHLSVISIPQLDLFMTTDVSDINKHGSLTYTMIIGNVAYKRTRLEPIDCLRQTLNLRVFC